MTLAIQPNKLPTNKLTLGGGLGIVVGDIVSQILYAFWPAGEAIELQIFGNIENLITYAAMMAIGWYIPDYANLPMKGGLK